MHCLLSVLEPPRRRLLRSAPCLPARIISLLLSVAVASGRAEEALKIEPVKAALTKAIASGQTPGAVFHLEHGRESAHFALGNRALVPTKEAMTEDTIFDAASLTKVIATATSVMVLVEQKQDPSRCAGRGLICPSSRARAARRSRSAICSPTSPACNPSLSQNPPWSGYGRAIKLACATLPETTARLGVPLQRHQFHPARRDRAAGRAARRSMSLRRSMCSAR